MDSQQTGVLTNGGSDDRSVGQSLKRSGTVPEIHEEPVDSLILSCPPDCDSEGLLLIDDQGIPYTLTPEGHKVPQIDSSRPDNPPSSQPMVQSSSLAVEDDSGPGNLDPLDPLDPLSPASSPSSGPRRVLYCPLCPRIFYYLSDLERHSITHSQNKPHVCLQCGKAFKRSSHLQRHKHIHTGERNFVCPICSKRFREAGELQRHQRVHTGEKPYQCPLCHTRFAERNTLRRHTKRKHPYHQAAMEMLTERGGGGGGGDEDEGTEEWYSSNVSNLDNSDSEPDSEVIS
ncbi:hypothetical protein J4Q44_G00392240 [Coregonus suidteri]|uniref:C2H2-type domain-containing protein n=1 Tax=Coregonus suidteri TaxID=861788 RepID=A0AAN8K828_9TELE